jgi:hypothetical protein
MTNQAPTTDIGRLSDVFGLGGGIDASFVDVVETSQTSSGPCRSPPTPGCDATRSSPPSSRR